MGTGIWWMIRVLIGLVALLMLFYGIETLIGAFSLKNPLEFIMLFFSASLLVLVSLVGLLYPVLQIYSRCKAPSKETQDDL
jgi:hypothetical protein